MYMQRTRQDQHNTMKALIACLSRADGNPTWADVQYLAYIEAWETARRETGWCDWRDLGRIYRDNPAILANEALTDLNLNQFKFDGLNLRATTFISCDLSGAGFQNTNLLEASLQGCDLRGTNLQLAANLDHLNLRGCDLYGTTGIWQFGPVGSRVDILTADMRENRPEMFITAGCFYGRLATFVKEVEASHGNPDYSDEAWALAEYRTLIPLLHLIEARFRLELGLNPDPEMTDKPDLSDVAAAHQTAIE